MKRLLAIAAFLALATSATLAQDKDSVKLDDLFSPSVKTIGEGKGEVERFHGRLMFSETNTYLTSKDVTNDFWKKYYNSQRLQHWGQYLWQFGLSYIATDMVFMMINGRVGNTVDASLIVGAACTLVGGVLDFGGWMRLGNLAATYNSDPSVRRNYSFNLGPTRSGGFGLSLIF